MTITEITTAHRHHDTLRPPTRGRRDDMAAVPSAVRSEWIKLRSLRSTRIFLGLPIVAGLLLSWILAVFVKTDPNTHEVFTVAQTFIFSSWLTTVMATVMGTLLFTNEIQHGTLSSVIAAQPARWVTVLAKATIAASFGLVMGVVGMCAGLAGAVAGGLEAGDTSTMMSSVVWGLLLLVLTPVLGLGVGMIIRHSAAAASTILVWAFVVENLFRGFAPPTWSRFLPFSAADGLLGIQSAGDDASTRAAALSRPVDAAVFAAYVLIAVAVGTVLLNRRDAD